MSLNWEDWSQTRQLFCENCLNTPNLAGLLSLNHKDETPHILSIWAEPGPGCAGFNQVHV